MFSINNPHTNYSKVGALIFSPDILIFVLEFILRLPPPSPTLSSACLQVALAQTLQTLCSPSTPRFLGSSTLCGEHPSQTTSPQRRQWCLLFVRVKATAPQRIARTICPVFSSSGSCLCSKAAAPSRPRVSDYRAMEPTSRHTCTIGYTKRQSEHRVSRGLGWKRGA